MRRNETLHGGLFVHPNTLVQQTIQAMDDFCMAQGRGELTRHLGDPQPILGWKALEVGWFKANWDAAEGEKSGHTGLGVVIRDSHGILQGARCATRQGCLDPALDEAVAMLLSIQLCRDLGLTRIHFEGDAKGVVDGINSAEADRGWIGQVIADIKLAIQVFEDWKVSFIRREDNQVANSLAKFAVKFDMNNTRGGMPPDCISEMLLLEHFALAL
jgi:ribonuclease HI